MRYVSRGWTATNWATATGSLVPWTLCSLFCIILTACQGSSTAPLAPTVSSLAVSSPAASSPVLSTVPPSVSPEDMAVEAGGDAIDAGRVAVATVIGVAGTVTRRSLAVTAGEPLIPYAIVYADDVLQLDANASVTLLCLNEHLFTLRMAGVNSIDETLCQGGAPLSEAAQQRIKPDAGRLKVHAGSLILEAGAREAEADYGRIPILLTPRNTHLLTLEPQIRWIDVPDAIEYQLSLSSLQRFDDVVVDAAAPDCVDDDRTAPNRVCALAWPATWPLERDQRYFLTVSARLGIASPWRTAESSSLRTLDAEAAAALQAEASTMEALDLDGGTQQLLLAGLYAEAEVYARSIPLYEEVVAVQPTPVFYVTLGDAYRAVELLRYAFDAYQQALDLLDAGTDDSAVRAAAAFGMGQVEYRRGQYQLAELHFVQAVELYTQIDAKEELQAAEHALAETRERL